MPEEKHDPIADTGMFRAFVAKGEAESAERRPQSALIVIGLLLVVVVAAVIWLIVS